MPATPWSSRTRSRSELLVAALLVALGCHGERSTRDGGAAGGGAAGRGGAGAPVAAGAGMAGSQAGTGGARGGSAGGRDAGAEPTNVGGGVGTDGFGGAPVTSPEPTPPAACGPPVHDPALDSPEWPTGSPPAIFLPTRAPAVRGILLELSDVLEDQGINSYNWRKFADTHAFALVNLDPGGYCRALDDPKATWARAAGYLAQLTGHAELTNAPVFLIFRRDSQTCARLKFAQALPERTIGYIINPAEGHYDLFGSDAFNKVPGLVIYSEWGNWKDNEPPYGAEILAARERGALQTAKLIWNIREETDDATTFFLAWTDQLIRLRVPADADPCKGPVKLTALAEQDGWLGDMTPQFYRDEWDKHEPIWNDHMTIAPYADYKGDKAHASWIPNGYLANVWRGTNGSSPTATGAHAVMPDDVQLAKPLPPYNQWIEQEPLPVFEAEEALPLGVTMRDANGASSVVYFDGDRMLAEAKTAPFTAGTVKLTPGWHSLLAIRTGKDGSLHASQDVMIVVGRDRADGGFYAFRNGWDNSIDASSIIALTGGTNLKQQPVVLKLPQRPWFGGGAVRIGAFGNAPTTHFVAYADHSGVVTSGGTSLAVDFSQSANGVNTVIAMTGPGAQPPRLAGGMFDGQADREQDGGAMKLRSVTLGGVKVGLVVISPRQLLAALPEPVVEGNRIKLGGQAIGLDGKDLVLDKHAAVLPQP